jgi:hypothetical protein
VKVVIRCRSNLGTPFDEMLIRALSAEKSLSRVSVEFSDRTGTAARSSTTLFDDLHYRLARIDRKAIDLQSLEMSARPARASTPADREVLVDFTEPASRHEGAVSETVSIVRLWSDAVPSDLSYRLPSRASTDPSKGATLTVTVKSPGQPARVLETSDLPCISPYPAANRMNALARSVSLLVRALKSLAAETPPDGQDAPSPPGAERTRFSDFAFFARVAARAAIRLAMRQRSATDEWFLAYRSFQPDFIARTVAPKPGGFKRIASERGRFFADPCVLSRQGATFIFFEDYRADIGRGVISYCAVGPDGEINPPAEVLAAPYHLSYPFVFEHDGTVFLVPESSANRTVDLYAATAFPGEWEKRATLLSDINATDATIHFDGEMWWMFAAVGEFGAAAWDELFIFFSHRVEGPWTPHPLNPVKRDSSSSRPAGALFLRNGKLIRPAQDCSRTYGGGVTLCEVEILTPASFRERVVDKITCDWIEGAKALHTLTASDTIEVIDAKL